MEKERIGIYPGFGTSTHELLHKELIELVDATPITYTGVYMYAKNTRLENNYILLLSILKFIGFNLNRNNRNFLRYKGIVISHSIIEYHIRKDKIGRFIFFSGYTFLLIRRTITFIRCYKLLEKKFDIKLILGGDDAYPEGSILGQLALKNNIPHLYLKQFHNFISGFKFNNSTLYAGPDFKEHPDFFSSLNLNNTEISRYEKELSSIVTGEQNYYYVRNRHSYTAPVKMEQNVMLKDALVLFLHDFLDSPGVYGGSVFHDQWRWIKECVRIISKNNDKLVIKIHPNLNVSNKPAIEELKNKYKPGKSIFYLEDKVSLSDMKRAGIKGILTLFGTVIDEAGFLDIPCISAANNPYMAFHININTSSRKQFRHELDKLCKGKYWIGEKDFKMLAIQAFIAQKLIFKYRALASDLPYDDVDPEVFQSIFHKIPDTANFGNLERRQVFLNSDLMSEYVASRIEEEKSNIRERFNFLINN